MNVYCTLFDSFYLTRAIAMHESLVRTGESFRLYAYCFDDLAMEALGILQLPGVVPVPLNAIESPELLAIKPGRSRGEYCWTCTPVVIRHTLEQFGHEEATYVDADLYFFGRPGVLLEEFRASGGSVLLTEHRYYPRHDQSATSGIYCVQFMTFKKDAAGMEALRWWEARCIEWCFSRLEDGKFGDQKYLDDWTTRFRGVHVLKHVGGGIAPWNIESYDVGPGPKVDGTPVVFYHFHALKWFESEEFDLTGHPYRISPSAFSSIYQPYMAALRAALTRVRAVMPEFSRGRVERPKGVSTALRNLRRKLSGTYHVVAG
jgi:hypothetical protein